MKKNKKLRLDIYYICEDERNWKVYKDLSLSRVVSRYIKDIYPGHPKFLFTFRNVSQNHCHIEINFEGYSVIVDIQLYYTIFAKRCGFQVIPFIPR